MATLRKQEISEKIASELNGTRSEAEAALNAVLGTIQSALLSGDRVVLTGFGSFEVRNVKARRVRPIRANGSGDLITVPAHKRVGFTPGAELSKSAKV